MEIRRREISQGSVGELVQAGVHPLIARIYAGRGLTIENLDLSMRGLCVRPMKDLERAATRLAQAITQKERVIIVGDYDTDGATSTALLVHFIRRFGGDAQYLIPDRVQDGYGLTPTLAERAKEIGGRILLTVDNGISAVAGVAKAKSLGMDVIVTDHHLPGESLPQPYALVNPNQPDCDFPWKSTCGVGVAWYLAGYTWRALVQHFGASPAPVMSEYLDLVALGTVADVVPLEQNNRILVRQGLQRLREGKGRLGIRALIQVAGVEAGRITETDFGFRLAPRLNAAGRLDDMSKGVALLLSEDPMEAESIASLLDQLNRERRSIEAGMLEEAEQIVEGLRLDTNPALPVLVHIDSGGHEGVVGLVAGRLREKYGKPCIVFAPGQGNVLKGSARSVDGVHIRDLLADYHAIHPGVIERFGGHAMAAGLTVSASKAQEFCDTFTRFAGRQIAPEQLREITWTDGDVPPQWITRDTAALLENAGPWGQRFPTPLFEGSFFVREAKRIGKDRQTLRMRLSAGRSGPAWSAIAFRRGEQEDPRIGETVALLYRMSVNRYQGSETLQIEIVGVR